MVEVSRYKRGLYWRSREKQRYNLHDETYELELPSIPDSAVISAMMDLSAKSLRLSLCSAGAKDPWMIDRADIYQKAVNELSKLFNLTPLSESLYHAAFQELALIAKSLEMLFSGGIVLSPRDSDPGTTAYNGYYLTPNEENIRVAIYQKFCSSHSPQVARTTNPNCQIGIKEIVGRSSRGRAIAGSDTELRVGLRCGYPGGSPLWAVSLEGAWHRHTKGHGIRPLSQAIQVAKIHHNLEPDNQESLTFHYYDPETALVDPDKIRNSFGFFNHCLREIFEGYIQS